jgi:hypothetical protein
MACRNSGAPRVAQRRLASGGNAHTESEPSKPGAVVVAAIVVVSVVATVDVAVHLNGNATVDVFVRASCRYRPGQLASGKFLGSDHAHGGVPIQGHDHGCGHAHEDGHVGF